jgi:hypothetical protein
VLARRQAGNPIEKFDALIAAKLWRPSPALPRAMSAASPVVAFTVIDPWTVS